MELTDVQWELLKSLVEPKTPAKRRGRPWKETRAVLEGVLWILRTGAQWGELPQGKFAPYQTCHRRFQRWVHEGVLDEVLDKLPLDHKLQQQGVKLIAPHKPAPPPFWPR